MRRGRHLRPSRKRPSWRIWGCTRCSIAARKAPGSAPATATQIHCHKSMGHVADIFTSAVLGDAAGRAGHRPHALFHGRRHGAAQRAAVLGGLQQGPHRGGAQRQHHQCRRTAAELERRGSIFQASSDTEVILHLVAHSRERTLAGALRDALLQLEGAFSLVFLAEDRIIVARDPHGFRPLAVGEMEILGRTQVLRVRLGNLRLRPDRRRVPERSGARRDGDRGAGRHDARALRAGAAARAVRLRARVLLAAGFHRVRPRGAGIAREAGPAAGARVPRRCRPRGAGARLGRGRGHRLCGGIRPAVPPGA